MFTSRKYRCYFLRLLIRKVTPSIASPEPVASGQSYGTTGRVQRPKVQSPAAVASQGGVKWTDLTPRAETDEAETQSRDSGGRGEQVMTVRRARLHEALTALGPRVLDRTLIAHGSFSKKCNKSNST